jgi:hypothetical protein
MINVEFVENLSNINISISNELLNFSQTFNSVFIDLNFVIHNISNALRKHRVAENLVPSNPLIFVDLQASGQKVLHVLRDRLLIREPQWGVRNVP